MYNMKDNLDDILNSAKVKENPFKVPSNYFSQMEDSVHKKIHANSSEDKKPSYALQFKTFATMLTMFLIVFGFGYGVISLTNIKGNLHYNGISNLFIDNNNSSNTLTDEDLLIIFGENEIYSTAEQINTIETNIQPIEKE